MNTTTLILKEWSLISSWSIATPWEFSCCYSCSVSQSCLTLWDPIDYSMPGFPVLHQLPCSSQTHVHWVSCQFLDSIPRLIESQTLEVDQVACVTTSFQVVENHSPFRIRTNQNKPFDMQTWRGWGKKRKKKERKTDFQLGKQAEAGSRFFFFHCHGFDPYNSALWYASLKKNAKRQRKFCPWPNQGNRNRICTCIYDFCWNIPSTRLGH